jgi:clan AA aspartic protease
MILGAVNAAREAIVRLVVVGPHGRSLEIAGVVDTGYSGSLTLPRGLITTLALSFRSRGSAILADESESVFDSFEATVIWDGRPRGILVDAAETEPLIGMDMLDGHELTVHVVDGGQVRIDARPV